MLKIKSNVDMKELEKFGFEYKEDPYAGKEEGKWHYYEKKWSNYNFFRRRFSTK